jgi:hypothetical protein
MILLFAAAATAAAPGIDLGRPAARSTAREQAAPVAPAAPRGLDTRTVAPRAPEVEKALLDAEQGPMLRVGGALGGRRNRAQAGACGGGLALLTRHSPAARRAA